MYFKVILLFNKQLYLSYRELGCLGRPVEHLRKRNIFNVECLSSKMGSFIFILKIWLWDFTWLFWRGFMSIRCFFGSSPGFVYRTQSDPGFVNSVGSSPGFVNPVRSDPIRSDPVRSGPIRIFLTPACLGCLFWLTLRWRVLKNVSGTRALGFLNVFGEVVKKRQGKFSEGKNKEMFAEADKGSWVSSMRIYRSGCSLHFIKQKKLKMFQVKA